MTTEILPFAFDFTDPDVNLAGVPHDEFAALRKSAPIHWVEQTEPARAGMSVESGTGYWAVTKHADVAEVSKNSKIFSSRENGVIIRLPETASRESVEMTQVVIINHGRLVVPGQRGQYGVHRGLGHLVHGLVGEGKAVAAAAGIELHDDPWEMNVLATQRGSAHYPSMQVAALRGASSLPLALAWAGLTTGWRPLVARMEETHWTSSSRPCGGPSAG